MNKLIKRLNDKINQHKNEQLKVENRICADYIKVHNNLKQSTEILGVSVIEGIDANDLVISELILKITKRITQKE